MYACFPLEYLAKMKFVAFFLFALRMLTVFRINTVVYVEHVIDIRTNKIGISNIQIDMMLKFSFILIHQKTSENTCHQISFSTLQIALM